MRLTDEYCEGCGSPIINRVPPLSEERMAELRLESKNFPMAPALTLDEAREKWPEAFE